jgi:predicted lactoylglutathione lyase
MLLTHARFEAFALKAIADATKSMEVFVALSCENRAKVDELVANAAAAAGKTYNKPKDHDFVYGHGFQDLDSHVWEVSWLDPSAVKPL